MLKNVVEKFLKKIRNVKRTTLLQFLSQTKVEKAIRYHTSSSIVSLREFYIYIVNKKVSLKNIEKNQFFFFLTFLLSLGEGD